MDLVVVVVLAVLAVMLVLIVVPPLVVRDFKHHRHSVIQNQV
tara:strand:- start:301 stop:426 length:126 start_codon:yes stop_codon:yes gene_type:complete